MDFFLGALVLAVGILIGAGLTSMTKKKEGD